MRAFPARRTRKPRTTCVRTPILPFPQQPPLVVGATRACWCASDLPLGLGTLGSVRIRSGGFGRGLFPRAVELRLYRAGALLWGLHINVQNTTALAPGLRMMPPRAMRHGLRAATGLRLPTEGRKLISYTRKNQDGYPTLPEIHEQRTMNTNDGRSPTRHHPLRGAGPRACAYDTSRPPALALAGGVAKPSARPATVTATAADKSPTAAVRSSPVRPGAALTGKRRQTDTYAANSELHEHVPARGDPARSRRTLCGPPADEPNDPARQRTMSEPQNDGRLTDWKAHRRQLHRDPTRRHTPGSMVRCGATAPLASSR